MKFLLVFLILAAFPLAFAQEGLFVSQHNVTYFLGENDFSVEEVIVFENIGAPSGNLFKNNVYITRGNAWDVEVNIIGRDIGYFVDYSPLTTININLLLWRGEKNEVTLKYKRSDLLFRGDFINVISGLALGKYSWTTDRVSVKFIAPEGFQFGNVTPYVTKTIERGRETLNYDISPVNIANLTAIKEGLSVRIEYAKYSEMATSEMRNAEELILDVESDLGNANKSIENAMSHGSDITSVLILYENALDALGDSKNALELAEVKLNPFSSEYSPYEAYYYAKRAKNLARDASREAGESKDLANFEIQKTLKERISSVGSQLSGQAGGAALVPGMVKPPEVRGPLVSYGIAIILILAVLVMFGAYMYTGGGRETRVPKRGSVGDFKAIGELKYKTFTGFDKKVDTVKQGVELATEIRNLMKRKEKLELGLENLRKKRMAGEISENAFELEKGRLYGQIDETVGSIDRLQSRLKEIKKAKR